MVIIPKKDTKCRECVWSTYLEAECVLACGYICHLNPFKKVAMGLSGIHSERKQHLDEEKEEKYQEKVTYTLSSIFPSKEIEEECMKIIYGENEE